MIKTIDQLQDEYKNYAHVNGKIRRMVKDGKYIPIIKGLYETDKNTPGYYLAILIYGPSYLSFDYALAYYNLIPEAVYTYTSATYNKRKSKTYVTPFGTFIYRDVPKEAFRYDVNVIEVDGYVYHIASKEKALCDKLYSLKPLNNLKELKIMLFEDLRINEDEFNHLNKETLVSLATKYKSKNLRLLVNLIKQKGKS